MHTSVALLEKSVFQTNSRLDGKSVQPPRLAPRRPLALLPDRRPIVPKGGVRELMTQSTRVRATVMARASAPVPHNLPATSLIQEITPIGTPVPEGYSKIRTLTKNELKKNGRVIVVGDIHGCYDEFCALLEECEFNQDKDNLIMVGDLVNKGPESVKVLKKAMKIKAIVVRGNHEDNALVAYYAHARGEEIEEKYDWVKNLKKKYVTFLESLPFAVRVPSHKLIAVHAGLVPGTDLEKQDMFAMYRMRDLRKCVIRDSWIPLERGILESVPWASQWQGPEHVIFGHDSSRRLQFHPYATGIDTGAVQGDHLSACVFPPAKDIPYPHGPASRENLGMQLVSVNVEESRKMTFPKPREELTNLLVSSVTSTYYSWLDMYQSFEQREEQQKEMAC